MRRVTLFFIVLLLLSIIPEEIESKCTITRDIDLKSQKIPVKRSVLPVSAWIDEDIVHVSFLDSPQFATITIKDQNGIVLTKEIYSFPSQVQLLISDLDAVSVIEIEYGEVSVYGMLF